jgi:pyruvate carboxylase
MRDSDYLYAVCLRTSTAVDTTVCYTGDITNPNRGQYNLEYYLKFVRELVGMGIHVLAIKDMAGLLKPHAATMLVSALRKVSFDFN